MLRELLYREWKLHGVHMLIVLGMMAAFQIYFVLRVDAMRLWMVATAVFMAFQTIVPFTREDKFQSGDWVLTLPVSRRQIVRSRWAAAWLLILAGYVIAFALALALPGSRMDLTMALNLDTILLALGVASLILALLLPFTIRYGLTGVLVFMVAAQILGAGLLVAAIMAGSRRGAGRGLSALIEGTRELFLGLQAAWTPAVFHVVALAALVLVNWLGYRLALALYSRREF